MRLHMAAVDREFGRDRPGCCDLLEEPTPDAARGPAVEAVVDRGGRAIGLGHVPPAAAGLEDMQDARDNPAVIHPRLAGLAARQMRLDPRDPAPVMPSLGG